MTGFPLYHCDDPLHGYDCFHLDRLTESEEGQLTKDFPEFGYLETLAEVDDEIQDLVNEKDRTFGAVTDLEEDINLLYKYRRLLEKRLRS